MDKVMLLPCPNPWCGSHDDNAVPEGEDIWQHPALSPVYRVQCPYCPVKGPTASTEQQAIIAWNTRATPAPDSEKLREALEAGRTFLAKANSAWACGEPPHRVKTMLDAADAFQTALDRVPGASL